MGFITVTAHFISTDWNLKSVVLETSCMSKSHTKENIAEELTRICNEWKILHKVVTVVTDNASNMVAAVDLMRLRHYPCFAHTLNLVVQDSIKNTEEIKLVKEKVKRVVAYFLHSVTAANKLRHLQEQNNQPVKKLIQEVETRWNSTFHMFKRFAEQSELVTTALCLLGKQDLCITKKELELVQNASVVLEPFEDLTGEMSAEKVTSLSKVIPIVRGMQAYMSPSNDSELSEAQQLYVSSPLGKELNSKMSRRFSILERSLCTGAATILDPRFKKIPFASADNVKYIVDNFTKLMHTESSEQGPSTSNIVPQLNQVPAQKARKTAYWSIFDAKADKTAQAASRPSTGPHIELRRYFEEAHIPRDEDPLAWWKEHSVLFPKLSDLAKKFLCVPASSVPSERLFSKAGELVSQRRSCLKDTNINMILFLNKNMK